MCGICGFVGSHNPGAIDRMRRPLFHRGPDFSETLIDGPVHLGHTRLVIIDQAGGGQPMVRADGSAAIVFNGEIYDHLVLQAELQRRGHIFRSRSDTEVILAAYREWGVDCLSRLSGMFAFVIHDRAADRLFGARDRFGKKPFYYTTQPIGDSPEHVAFAFASELTSLGEHPAIRRSCPLSMDGIVSYLVHDAPTGRQTMREGIAQLLPGEAFTFDLVGSALRRWRYWEPKVAADREGTEKPDARRLLELLDAAVARRMVADVPLGVLLSGGVDSSAIVALMARHRPAGEIPSFSFGFDERSFDESRYAKKVAEYLRPQFHHGVFNIREWCRDDLLSSTYDRLDEPIADPSFLPTKMLSDWTRKRVTVALSGEGGDELFAGYDPFRALGPARWYRRLVPAALRPGIRRVAHDLIPRSESNMSLDFKVARFLRGIEVPRELELATWLGSFSLATLSGLLPDHGDSLRPERVFGDVIEAYGKAGPGDVSRALDFFQRFYLPDDILRKVDRASMLHSLEVRCPMLDSDLAEYVNALPASAKKRGSVTKRLLKEALLQGFDGKPLIPPEIIHRPKKGFGIPVANWIRTVFRPQVETMAEEWPERLGFFDRGTIRQLVEQHLSGSANHAKEVWSLLVLSRWARRCEW